MCKTIDFPKRDVDRHDEIMATCITTTALVEAAENEYLSLIHI